MENHILHFSSPKQNNDFIVYHNRAKSTFGGSQAARLKGKTMAPESARDCNTKRSRPERHGPAASSDFTSPSHGYPLQNRINIVKELLDSSAQSSTHRNSLVLDTENEKRLNDLEDELGELRKRLKARDVRINYLVQENETAREKLSEVKHIENQNSLFHNENKCLKSEVEILSKRVSDLEEEKITYLSEKHAVPKSTGNNEEISRGIAKYTRYIVNYIETMENKNVASFYFEERFGNERHLSKLIKAKDFGIIALNAFRYISDLLAHVAAPAQPKREQKKTHLMPKEKKEYKVQPSEPSSICISPLKNDSKENTPRSLVRELEGGRGMVLEGGRGMILEGFEKVHEVRADSTHKVSKSAEGRKQAQELMKKCQTARESKHDVHRGSTSTGTTSHPLKSKNLNQPASSKIVKTSYAQMHGKGEGGRVRTRESNEREGETSKQGHLLVNKRRETSERERQTLLSSKRSDVRLRESEEEEIAKIERGLRSETPADVNKRVDTEDAETYASLGVNIKNFGEGQYGRRTRELEKNENLYRETEEDDHDHNMKQSISVKSLLKHGAGIRDQLSPKEFLMKDFPYENRVASRKSEDNGKEILYSKVRGNQVHENDLKEDNKYERHLEMNPENRNKRTHYMQSKPGSKKMLTPCDEETTSEKLSKLLSMSHGSNDEGSLNHIVRESASYNKKLPHPQQLDRLEDGNRNFQSNKDPLRLYSVQSPNRPFSVQSGTPAGYEHLAERFVTFDGTDSLFASGEKEPGSGNMIKRACHRPSESEYYSLGPQTARAESAQHQRYSSEINSATIAETLIRKRIEQNTQAHEMLHRKSTESKRSKQSRGDFNS